ncbi:meiosis regulator and mRNA stability factor 1 [Trichonephila inaurata madagascariensis]|uniref:Meiosis regulator and mRNA stability factor 1 n=1 Tax=Trichonephila inaurata madagascariensis TaxID=2747483 RepID=A0A8X6WN01_9ARAC|nr:meiosis regulator and mRNA stability factor 1 [Trichonephila inaurata madagascariensis]
MSQRILLYPCSAHLKIEEGSKSNIAAKFQNALNLHVLPPIGVFWDIENCQVPKGKSAIALVQNIREKFFEKHREAEFMCVCDINKESKIVIQELLFAQVTVVHISATSKNAADDKLKQCMKRFVDTHGAPATLLLISDDVNFASDLSDFRHRHNIRIILVHRGHAHQSLLTCAHEHYNFYAIAQNLPARSPVKSSDNRPCELVVSDLPLNRKEGQIKNKLHKLSNNCGGKVIAVKGSKAVIRFANADATEKAKKRMDKEIVFGNKISVNFRTRSDTEFCYSPPRDHGKESDSSDDSYVTSSSRDSSLSPKPKDNDKVINHICNNSSVKKFDFPPPPIINDQNSPSLLRQENLNKHLLIKNSVDSTKFFLNVNNSEVSKERKTIAMDWNNIKSVCQTTDKFQEVSAFSPFKKDQDYNVKKYPQRNVGRVSPFLMQDSDLKSTKNFMHLNDSVATRRNHVNSSSFQMYSSHGFHGLPQSISMPMSEIQRISDPIPYCAQWSGLPSISNESAQSISSSTIISSDGSSCVELHVSNLDPTFEVNEMKKILLSVFSEHVMVIHISMSLQPDGSAKATVKVPSFQDAQYAISRLHRRKIGHKRILISHVSSEKNPPFHILKSETVALLNDIPAKNLPLIKFRELYEKRYHRPIAVSELYKMRDAVTIQGDSGSRMVYLNSDYCKTPSLPDSEDSQEFSTIERPYCERHFHVSDSQGWAEQYSICPLPLVYISLKTLSPAVHKLLDSHQGSLPLISFCDCFEAEIGPLPVVGNVECAVKDDDSGVEVTGKENSTARKGVPLEHLIACVTGVEVAKSVLCIKKVQWLENKIVENQISQNFSPALAGQLNLFGREVMDLLKGQPQCLVAFNKFIPTYHHHFGRQCRVADYGFTKLIDLLEAIPHIVQVLGEGQNRQVTLTHRTQVKRFAAELLRILKSRASKQLTVSEFSHAYEQVIEKPFEITSYGVCEIQDMLDEVPENIIVICKSGTDTVIGIPKREQTAEEIERTKQFAAEVVELMKHTPHCTMAFNKFIPAYHHHFGKQCRVADYGFTKLVELFEAIPSVLEVTGTGEDKILKLVEKEQHKILTERLIAILKMEPNEVIDITKISSAYSTVHGHALRPMDFGFSDLHELLEKMDSSLRIVVGFGRTYVTLVDQSVVQQISVNVCRILMENPDGKMSMGDICKIYQSRFGQKINLSLHLQDMVNLIKVENDFVQLTPLQMLARDVILLLQEHGGQISFSTFGNLFQQKFGESICTAHYGFPNLYALLENLSDYFSIKGKKQKRTICLNSESLGPLPDFTLFKSHSNGFHSEEKSDILSDPIPSCVPSPNLEPDVNGDLKNFMGFETPPVLASKVVLLDDIGIAREVTKKDSYSSHAINTTCAILPHQVHQDCPISEKALTVNSSPVKYFNPQLYMSLNAQTSTLSPKEPMFVQTPTVIECHKNYIAPTITHLSVGPNIISMDCENKLPISSYSEGKSYSKSSTSNIFKSKESESCEDLTKYSEKIDEMKENDLYSSKSTPTKTNRQLRRRNRIAAHFSMPID